MKRMQSKAATVDAYLKQLPEDRRAAIAAVRKAILKSLDKGYQETMQYGMIGYSVPHSIYPAGYHCDPKQPLPFASLASQKNHMAVYLMCMYGHPTHEKWFRAEWEKSVKAGRAKKLDMGKSCIRFKKLEDIDLDLIGEAISRVSVKELIKFYEDAILVMNKGAAKPKAASAGPKKKAPAKKKAIRAG